MKLTKELPIIKPEVSDEMISTYAGTETIKRYDFPVYLAKFKNGIYRKDNLVIFVTDARWKEVKKAALESITLKIKSGRFHDYGFIK